jgi:hypothetical protein
LIGSRIFAPRYAFPVLAEYRPNVYYLKAISELAAGGGFTSEKVMEISRTFDTHFPVEP